jgi:uncharacterized Zn-binding protein involved in type VI secretion
MSRKPAIKQGDRIVATDTHIVLVPSVTGATPTPLPHPFSGTISGNVSPNVRINGRPAALVGSTAVNSPPHTPTPPGTGFQTPPTNLGTIVGGSATVMVNGKPLARAGDPAQTCADPAPNLAAQLVTSEGTVLVG